MTVSRIDVARVEPGRLSEQVALAGQVSDRLQELGLSRLSLKLVSVGGDVTGAVYSVYTTGTMTSYGAELEIAQADEEVQSLIARIYAPDGPATLIGTSLLSEIDPDPSAGPLEYKVATVRSSRVKPGRNSEVPQLLEASKPLVERYGGSVRFYTSVVGGPMTGTLFTVVGYPSHEALGTGLDALSSDAEAREFLANVFGPAGPVELISMGIHTDITPA